MFSLYLNIEPATEWRGHEMPTVWHHHPEKRWLWLDLLFDVQDRNLLGHQTSSLGPECKNIYLHTVGFRIQESQLTRWNCEYDFFFCCTLQGRGDTSGGCRCQVNYKPCHPNCQNCHWGKHTNEHTHSAARAYTIWRNTGLSWCLLLATFFLENNLALLIYLLLA